MEKPFLLPTPGRGIKRAFSLLSVCLSDCLSDGSLLPKRVQSPSFPEPLQAPGTDKCHFSPISSLYSSSCPTSLSGPLGQSTVPVAACTHRRKAQNLKSSPGDNSHLPNSGATLVTNLDTGLGKEGDGVRRGCSMQYVNCGWC